MALALAACGGKVDTYGTSSSLSASASGGASSGEDASTPPHPDYAPFTAAEVMAAQARCALPEGPVEEVTQRADVISHVIGAWYRCDADSYEFGPQGPAIQLLPDFTFASLEATSDGGLAARSGYDFTGTWEPTNSAGSSVGAYWYIDFYCGACAAATSPAFETSPRRMKAHRWFPGGWLVPLTHDP
jgi:hypothetical protein